VLEKLKEENGGKEKQKKSKEKDTKIMKK